MSTKIYDAFVFNKNYSLYELNKVINIFKDKINPISAEIYARSVLMKFFYYYDFYTIHGKERCLELAEKNKDSNKPLSKLFENLANESMSKVKFYIELIMDDIITDKNDNNIYKSNLYIFPLENKILCMYFGHPIYLNSILELDYLLDYHYQNQTDKPEDISDLDWARRYQDWDLAIGSDYIPANHGFSINLLSTNFNKNLMVYFNELLKNPDKSLWPSLDTRINKMIDTFNDYPEFDFNDKSYSEIDEYMNSDVYKKWKQEKYNYIKSKLIDSNIIISEFNN